VRFGLASISYEIDLSAKNAAAFRKQLAPFIKHARAARGQRRRAERTASSRERSADIRACPAGVIEQYETAQGS
jgi:hypothetical protein